MKKEKLKALLDIGSNTVRLVVYAPPYRFPNVFINKRFYCELGKGLSKNKKIDNKKLSNFYNALKVFKSILTDYNVKEFEILGTAAIREASNSIAIKRKIREILSKNIKILSGKEESSLAGMSIISTFDNPRGLVADLGGGSLELVRVNKKTINSNKSLKIGTLRYYNDNKFLNISFLKKEILDKLKKSGVLNKNFNEIYLIGGAFRYLCKKYLNEIKCPNKIIHNFKVTKKDCRKFKMFLNKELLSVTSKNVDRLTNKEMTVPVAAIFLIILIRNFKDVPIYFSEYGLRESYNFSKLSKRVKDSDPFIESCKFISNLDSRNNCASDIHKYFIKMIPKKLNLDYRIIEGVSYLSDTHWKILSEYRSIQSFLRTLRYSWVGINFEQRLFVAYCLYNRYGSTKKYSGEVERQIVQLSNKERLSCEFLGLLLKGIYTASSGSKKMLNKEFLVFNNKKNEYEINLKYKNPTIEKEVQIKKINLIYEKLRLIR